MMQIPLQDARHRHAPSVLTSSSVPRSIFALFFGHVVSIMPGTDIRTVEEIILTFKLSIAGECLLRTKLASGDYEHEDEHGS
jgi:hypothetical protein